MKKERRTYSHEFKLKLVNIYKNGKSRTDIVKDYNIPTSALDRWIKNYKESGSFKAEGNRSAEENELIQLRKEVKYLRLENDILKQTALILGQK